MPPKDSCLEDPLVTRTAEVQSKLGSAWPLPPPTSRTTRGPPGSRPSRGCCCPWLRLFLGLPLFCALGTPQHQIPLFSHLNQACSGVLRYPTQKSQKTYWGVPVLSVRHPKDPRSMPGTESRHGGYVNLRVQGDTHTCLHMHETEQEWVHIRTCLYTYVGMCIHGKPHTDLHDTLMYLCTLEHVHVKVLT